MYWEDVKMDNSNQRLEYLHESTKQNEVLRQQLHEHEHVLLMKKIDVKSFEKVLKKEKKDVDKLEHLSIASMIAKYKHVLDERLLKEIDEYKDASVVYQKMKNDLVELQRTVQNLREEYESQEEEAKEFNDLLQAKRNSLEQELPDFKETIHSLEEEIRNLKLQIIDLRKDYEKERTNIVANRLKHTNHHTIPNPAREQPGRIGDFKRGYAEKQQYDTVSEFKQLNKDLNEDFKESHYLHGQADITDSMRSEISSIEEEIIRLILET